MDDTDHRKTCLRVSRAGAAVTPTHIQTEPDLVMAKAGLMYASVLRVDIHSGQGLISATTTCTFTGSNTFTERRYR